MHCDAQRAILSTYAPGELSCLQTATHSVIMAWCAVVCTAAGPLGDRAAILALPVNVGVSVLLAETHAVAELFYRAFLAEEALPI